MVTHILAGISRLQNNTHTYSAVSHSGMCCTFIIIFQTTHSSTTTLRKAQSSTKKPGRDNTTEKSSMKCGGRAPLWTPGVLCHIRKGLNEQACVWIKTLWIFGGALDPNTVKRLWGLNHWYMDHTLLVPYSRFLYTRKLQEESESNSTDVICYWVQVELWTFSQCWRKWSKVTKLVSYRCCVPLLTHTYTKM